MRARLLGIILMSLMLMFAADKGISAQTIKDSVSKEDSFRDFLKSSKGSFDNFNQGIQQDFNTFREKANQDFARFLKDNWSTFEQFKGEETYSKPKPPTVPIFPKGEPDAPRQDDTTRIIPPLPPVEHKDKREEELKDESDNDNSSKDDTMKGDDAEKDLPRSIIGQDKTSPGVIEIDYYGIILKAPALPANWPKGIAGKLDHLKITGQWEAASKSDFLPLVDYFNYAGREWNMNDWSLLKLMDEYARKWFQSKDDMAFFKWFISIQLGYDVRICFSEHLEVIYHTGHMIYGKPYFRIDNKKYICLEPEKQGGLFQIYQKQHEGAKRALFFDLGKSFSGFSDPNLKRSLSFSFGQRKHQFVVAFDQSFVRLYQPLPQSELNVYMRYSGGQLLDRQIKDLLLPVIQDMDEATKINFLLALVQHSFEYKTDPEQFGYEKWMVPHEILFYPYSDCEDRTIFFIYLVKLLTNLEVVGLVWEDHAAAAVHFKQASMKGSSIAYKNKPFMICDPTYMGASAGMCAEKYLSMPVEVFE